MEFSLREKFHPPHPFQELSKSGYLLFNLVSLLATSLANRLRAVGTLLVGDADRGKLLERSFPPYPLQELSKSGYLLFNLVSALATSLANRLRAVGTLVRYYELTYKTIGV